MLLCRTDFGLLPKLNCEKKKNLYCNIEIVLQETGEKKGIVLQYMNLYCSEAPRMG